MFQELTDFGTEFLDSLLEARHEPSYRGVAYEMDPRPMSRPSVSETGKERNLSWSRPATMKLRAKRTIAMVKAIGEPVRSQPRRFSRHVTKALSAQSR